MESTTSTVIVTTITDVLLRMNLSTSNCRGQCYDGAIPCTFSFSYEDPLFHCISYFFYWSCNSYIWYFIITCLLYIFVSLMKTALTSIVSLHKLSYSFIRLVIATFGTSLLRACYILFVLHHSVIIPVKCGHVNPSSCKCQYPREVHIAIRHFTELALTKF